jgi:hypothetical protein
LLNSYVLPPVADGLPGDRLRRRQPTAALIPPLPLVVAAFVLLVADASATARPGQCPIPHISAPDKQRRGRRQPRPGQRAGPARRPARLSGHLLRGWELGVREKAAIGKVPQAAWEITVDGKGQVRERRSDDACAGPRCAHRACWIEEAPVAELIGLLREGPGGDQLKGWPKTMRIFARRERPHPGAQLSLFEATDGWRYSLWVTNLPSATKGWRGQCAYIDAAHRVHARVEDVIRTGKQAGLGHFPSMTTG